jgi:hypothetical protein
MLLLSTTSKFWKEVGSCYGYTTQQTCINVTTDDGAQNEQRKPLIPIPFFIHHIMYDHYVVVAKSICSEAITTLSTL